MLYLIKFDVGQPADMSHRQLFEIWHSEAVAALSAKDAGIVTGIWKVAGERTVYVLVDVDDNHALDAVIEGLPILQKMGGSIGVTTIPVYAYEQWANEMKGLLAQNLVDA